VKKTVRRELQREGSLIRNTVVNESQQTRAFVGTESQQTRAFVGNQHDESRSNSASMLRMFKESSDRQAADGLAALGMIAKSLGQVQQQQQQQQQQETSAPTLPSGGAYHGTGQQQQPPPPMASNGLSHMENDFKEPGRNFFICPICSSTYKSAKTFQNNHTNETKTYFPSCSPVRRMAYFLNKVPTEPASWLEAEIWNHLVDNIGAARRVAVREGQMETYEAFIHLFSQGGGN